MKVEVLISCMHQSDISIITQSNIQCDAVIVNQCDKEDFEILSFINKFGKECQVKFISTKERGLSRSRNMAIKFSSADICIIADDDLYYPDNINTIISDAYSNNDVDVKLFALERKDNNKSYPATPRKVGIRQILKSNSPQITFKRKVIIENAISFDEKMGSGTGNGGGEEAKFLMDCKKRGLTIDYTPIKLVTIFPSEGQWFKGINKEFMYNLGWTSRRILGNWRGYIYIWYQSIKKFPKYKNKNTFFEIVKALHKGFFEKR